MATGNTRAKSTRTTSKEKPPAVEKADIVVEKTTEPTVRKPVIPKDIDPNQYVVVRNGFQGRLVYKSKKTGERFVWSEFGSEQEMELSELKNAKNTYKRFFTNNWFMFDEPWVIDYLGMAQYYKYALNLDNFDDLFTKTPAQIEKTIAQLSTGQKKSVTYRARQLIADGAIDSNKVIVSLEKALGVELIER